MNGTRWTLAIGMVLGLTFAGAQLAACGSRQTPKTEIEDASSWRYRGLWVEEQGNRTYVMAVGISPNASMGRTFAMPNAEEDARSKLSNYVGAVTKTFRERLARSETSVGKDTQGGVQNSAAATQRNDTADRTVADNFVQGMETVNSYIDEKSDELFVLARVDAEQLRRSLSASDALSEDERARVSQNSADVRAEFDAALRDSAHP